MEQDCNSSEQEKTKETEALFPRLSSVPKIVLKKGVKDEYCAT